MPAHNEQIAANFTEIADLLEIQGANPFRIRAYRNAARTVGELGTDVQALMQRGLVLTSLPGIGTDLAGQIQEFLESGRSSLLARLHKQLPLGISELLKIPGLGPKRVRSLYQDLGIETLEQLLRAAHDGRIRALPGFGVRTEQQILDRVQHHLGQIQRFKISLATHYADDLVAYLHSVKGVRQLAVAGSLRRMRETIGDLDILVATESNDAVSERFIAYEDVKEVLLAGPKRASVVLRNGLQVDLRLIAPVSFGAALQYLTGSKAHNIALRRLAQAKGFKLNEYGLFRGRERIAGETEESVYKALSLSWIPPELREDRGEIEAAQTGRLPRLVELSDLRGDLHTHSTASDGHNTISEMAEAAREAGLEYIAITEHSRRLTVAHGLDPVALSKQIDEIDRLNARIKGVTVLKGIEVDILEDGNLDLPDSILARLDLVIAAVHSKFELSRTKQTERILKAIEHPSVTILAHPTGRLIEEREPYDVDMLRVIRACKRCACYLEINAHPERLDLLDTHCQMAKDEGVLIAINSDAHSIFEFANLRYGIGQARRGWLERQDVLNTRPLIELKRLLKSPLNTFSLSHTSL